MREALRRGAAVLKAAGIEGAALDARLLLMQSAGLTRNAVLVEPSRAIDPAAYEALLHRRAGREPLALILGWQEFWSLRFAVSRDTLIPRADSEAVIEAARDARPPASLRTVLDLGTGTGCLLAAALTEFPAAWGVGTDRNDGAARLAAGNLRALGLHRRAAVLCADWAAPLAARFDLVVGNPPYVETPSLAGLMPEVRDFEPRRALDGGSDGLAAYRAILGALPGLLVPGGVAVLELGAGQGGSVGALAQATGLTVVTIRPDLAGVPRAMVLTTR